MVPAMIDAICIALYWIGRIALEPVFVVLRVAHWAYDHIERMHWEEPMP
jgi:Trk-type K+ transport system membrane component